MTLLEIISRKKNKFETESKIVTQGSYKFEKIKIILNNYLKK